MFENVCIFNNKVFVPELDSSLIAYEYDEFEIKNSNKKFKECFRLKIPLPNNFTTKNIFLDVVENYIIGLKCIIILAISIFNEISIFMYCNALRNSLFRIMTLPLPAHFIINRNSNLLVTHGPIFAVLFQDTLQMYSLLYKTNQSLNLNVFFTRSNKPFEMMHCLSLGQLRSKELLTVMLVILYRKISSESNEIKIIATSINSKCNDVPVHYIELSKCRFFPDAFQKSIILINITNISLCSQTATKLEEICWTNSYVFAYTNDSKILIFFNGTLKYVFNDPLPDVSYIRTEFCNVADGTIHLLLVDTYENAHILNTAENGNVLQLQKTWKKIVCVLSGDFMLTGSKWLLMLKNCDSDTWQEDCILSDISSIIPMDVIGQSMISAASMERTIPGIQANIQAGKAAVVEAKAEITMKAGATLDVIYRIKKCRPEDENTMYHVSTFQESLIDIILAEDENIKTEINSVRSNLSLTFQNQWQRIMDHRWILCWTFLNTDDKPICYPVVQILMQDQCVQCTQKVFVHKSSTFSIDDECQQEIKPSEKFSLIASLDIPQFPFESMTATAILSWYNGSSDSFIVPCEGNISFPQQMVFQASLSVSEIFAAELKDISTVEDLACLKVLQHQSKFCISTLHSHLSDFENTILSAADTATTMRLFEGTAYKGLVCVKSSSLLYGTHLRFKDCPANELEIEIFSKSTKEALLMVKYLYECLPEDTLILPCDLTASERLHLKQDSIMAMKNELDLLQYSLYVYNVDEEARKQSRRTFEEGIILIPKALFTRLRRELFKKESITDSIMRSLYKLM